MQEYNVKDHGDSLEKISSGFIQTEFLAYELVWKTFIGNKGNETIATIPNYSRDEERQKFAEHSYTVLESIFMARSILNSNVFSYQINDWNSYFELNISFVAFFTFLGRARDNLIKASNILIPDYSKELESGLKEAYSARHIVIHGKKVPLIQDQNGIPTIPVFSVNETTAYGWNDEHKLWAEASKMELKSIAKECERLIQEILKIANRAYYIFYDEIKQKLKVLNTKIKFEYQPKLIPPDCIFGNASGMSIYNIQFPVSGSLNK